jgi:hypothetical protein
MLFIEKPSRACPVRAWPPPGQAELFNLIDNYLSKYPLKTEKMKRVNFIKQFYLLRVDRNSQDINKFNE